MEIIDEQCSCGHNKSEHADALGGLAPGHGECEECECEKFTWVGFIMITS